MDQLSLDDDVGTVLSQPKQGEGSQLDRLPTLPESTAHGRADADSAPVATQNPGSDRLTDFSLFLSLCREARADSQLVARVAPMLIEHYRSGHDAREMGELEKRWYGALAEGVPDYEVYADDLYIADLWACWMVYSRKYLSSLSKDTIVSGGGSIADDVGTPNVIADLGCGIGYTTATLKLMWPSATVIGTNLPDIRQTLIAQAVGAQYGFDVVASLEEVGQADLVFASEYFEHFPRPVEHLRDVLRVLEPKAVVVANTFGAKSVGHFDQYEVDGKPRNGRETSTRFARTLRASGYRKVATKLWNSRPGYWRREERIEWSDGAGRTESVISVEVNPDSVDTTAPLELDSFKLGDPKDPAYQTDDQTLYTAVRAALRDAYPSAQLLTDKHETISYTIVKVNGKTIGYVSGSRKVRVQSPKLDCSVLIANPIQIPVAIEFVKAYVPEEAAT